MEKIYKEDILELINDNIEVPVDAYDQAQMDALEWLKYEVENLQPAEEIICCKDCKHSTITALGACKYCDVWFPDEATYVDGDFFCASAERRTGD